MATGWEGLRVMQQEPNCTLILPGPCQARCAFCVEPVGPDPSSLDEWLNRLKQLLETLPGIFRVLSISGGEPTLSPVFRQTLEILAERQSTEAQQRWSLVQKRSHHWPRAAMAAPVSSRIRRPVRMM